MPIIPENRVKTLRGKFNYTQEELAEQAGVETRTIQRAERGDSVKQATCAAIAAVFDMDVTELLSSLQKGMGLSRDAELVALALFESEKDKSRLREEGTEWKSLEKQLEEAIPMEDLLMILEELEAKKLIGYAADLGGVLLRPTFRLFHAFKWALDFDPEEDAKQVAFSACERAPANGPQIEEDTKLPPIRINRAIDLLKDNGYVKTRDYSDPEYPFGWVQPTWKLKAAFA